MVLQQRAGLAAAVWPSGARGCNELDTCRRAYLPEGSYSADAVCGGRNVTRCMVHEGSVTSWCTLCLAQRRRKSLIALSVASVRRLLHEERCDGAHGSSSDDYRCPDRKFVCRSRSDLPPRFDRIEHARGAMAPRALLSIGAVGCTATSKAVGEWIGCSYILRTLIGVRLAIWRPLDGDVRCAE